jgi:hypothetical protein
MNGRAASEGGEAKAMVERASVVAVDMRTILLYVDSTTSRERVYSTYSLATVVESGTVHSIIMRAGPEPRLNPRPNPGLICKKRYLGDLFSIASL